MGFSVSHGVEQELQVVDPETGKLEGKVEDILRGVSGGWRNLIGRDAYSTQLEYNTGISEGFDEILEGVPDLRGMSVDLAEEKGLALIASGANPISDARDGENFGEHHHIGVKSASEQSRVHNLLREFTPELMAISVNSPVFESRDSGFKSVRAFRSGHIRHSPRVSYDSLISYDEAELEERFLGHPRYWDVTPFTARGLPTVEVRLFDTQTSISNVIATAGLLEAIALKAKKMNKNNTTPPMVHKDIIKANRFNAIKSGLSAEFKVENNVKYIAEGESFVYHQNRPGAGEKTILASDAVLELLIYVEEETSELGVEDLVAPIKQAAEDKMTPADLQLQKFLSDGAEELTKDLIYRTKWEL